MKKFAINIFFIMLSFVLIGGNSVSGQIKLKIGDPAPGIKASKWFKGTPVTSFEKGKIYVVEFWATWCGPCKANIPHLTEMAHKYKDKVTVVGMDGSEAGHGEISQAEKEKLVEELVQKFGDKMDYNVALDAEDGYMYKNWMTASGNNGIPCSFVVNEDSKVVWIGHPIDLEKTLEELISGKYDLKAFAEKYGAQQDRMDADAKSMEKYQVLIKPVEEAVKNKDYAKAVSICEDLLAKYPEYKLYIEMVYYFPALANVNSEKILSILNEEKKLTDEKIRRIQYIITGGIMAEKPDSKVIDFALDFLTAEVRKNPDDLLTLSKLQRIYEYLKDYEKAIKTTEQFLVSFQKQGGEDPEVFTEMENKIVEYKKKLQN